GRSAGVGRTSVIGEAEGGVGTTVDARQCRARVVLGASASGHADCQSGGAEHRQYLPLHDWSSFQGPRPGTDPAEGRVFPIGRDAKHTRGKKWQVGQLRRRAPAPPPLRMIPAPRTNPKSYQLPLLWTS